VFNGSPSLAVAAGATTEVQHFGVHGGRVYRAIKAWHGSSVSEGSWLFFVHPAL